MSWTKWRGKELIDATDRAMAEALLDTANEIKAEANQQVPHDEGTLQDSGTVKRNPANPLEVHIGYGGGESSGFPYVPYALKWHEIPANFQKGRKHNYLRDPVNDIGPKALVRNLKKYGAKTWK